MTRDQFAGDGLGGRIGTIWSQRLRDLGCLDEAGMSPNGDIAAALRPVEQAAAAERQGRPGAERSATVAEHADSRDRVAAALMRRDLKPSQRAALALSLPEYVEAKAKAAERVGGRPPIEIIRICTDDFP